MRIGVFFVIVFLLSACLADAEGTVRIQGRSDTRGNETQTIQPGPVFTGRQFFEGFESGAMPPAGWSYAGSGSAYTWKTSTLAYYEGHRGAYIRWSDDIPQDEVFYTDVAIDVAGGQYILSFYTKGDIETEWADNARETVEINGTEVWSFDDVSWWHFEWHKFFIDLNAYDGETVQIGFRYAGFDANSHYFDAIMIDDGTGYIYEPPEPVYFPHNSCDGAIDLQALGLLGFYAPGCDGEVEQFTNTYNGFGCAPWGAGGDDQVYKIDLVAGQLFTANVWCACDPSDSPDYVLYVVTDCSDVAASCIAAVDDSMYPPHAETINFTAPFSGTYYLIVDGYNSGECSDETFLSFLGPIANSPISFGSLKATYR